MTWVSCSLFMEILTDPPLSNSMLRVALRFPTFVTDGSLTGSYLGPVVVKVAQSLGSSLNLM